MPKLSRFAGTLVGRKREAVLGPYRDAYAKTGISIGTWERVEKEGSFQMRTLWRIVDALGWPPEAAEMLLSDQNPDAPPEGAGTPGATDEHLQGARSATDHALDSMPREQREELEDLDDWVQALPEHERERVYRFATLFARAAVAAAQPLWMEDLLRALPGALKRRAADSSRGRARTSEDSTIVEPSDENFAMAAEKGEQDTKKGRKRTRPSPDPEPEGP